MHALGPQLYQTWCFVLLLVAPSMYGVAFEFGALTILSNAMSLLVRIGTWREAEQVATAGAYAVWMMLSYWLVAAWAVLVDSADRVRPWTRDVFIHLLLPMDSVAACALRRPYDRRRESMTLTVAIALVHGLLASLVDPPPYAHEAGYTFWRRWIGSFATVGGASAVQWLAHAASRRLGESPARDLSGQ